MEITFGNLQGEYFHHHEESLGLALEKG